MHPLTFLRPLAVLAATAVITVALGIAAERLMRRFATRHPDAPVWPLLRACRIPFWLTLASVLLLTGLPGTNLAAPATGALRHVIVLVLVGASGWLASRLVRLLINSSVNRYTAQRRDPARVRRIRTQTSMVSRICTAVIAVLAFASMLLTFPDVRSIGTSLLASTAVIGVVASLAAQSTLGNLFAGIQLAFGDMVRIGDVVVVGGEWGTVEEITLTSIVIATWDQRRIVMPVSYFAGKPFENWSRNDPRMTGVALLHLDHSTPIGELRAEFERVLKNSPLWDGRGAALQVTDTTPTTIVVRALMTAQNSGDIFDLRCEVRERLIAFLRERYPHALPRVATAPAPGIGMEDLGELRELADQRR